MNDDLGWRTYYELAKSDPDRIKRFKQREAEALEIAQRSLDRDKVRLKSYRTGPPLRVGKGL